MPSLLDDPYRPTTGLLGLDAPNITPPDDRTVDQGDALTSLYQTVMDKVKRERQVSADRGLWDDETGRPTQKGLLDAGLQLATNFEGGIRPTGIPSGLLAESLTPRSVTILNPDAPGFSDRISTRQPSRVEGVHDTADYSIGMDAVDEAAQGAKSNYANRVNEVIPRHIGVTDTTQDGFINHMVGNLKALYGAVPDSWKGGAANWYHGANAIAKNMADTFGTSVRAMAGNLAALSPQRVWDHNVEGATRVANIHTNHGDTPWDDSLDNVWTTGRTMPDGTKIPGFAETNAGWSPFYDAIKGKTLNEIDDPQAAALWVRLHDRANMEHNNVPIASPDGTRGGWLTNDDGSKQALQWGTLGHVGNALTALRDDSLPSISAALGDAHKVRNFYNNIISPDAGHDITIDTHAIAAALLRPLGSKNPEVNYGLGGSVDKKPWREGPDPWPTTMNSDPAGIKGMYPLYAEAYRRAAQDLNILPRELQSVTWEGVRGLYNSRDRRNPNVIQENSDLWKAVNSGDKSVDDVRSSILGRGIRDPVWFKGEGGAVPQGAR